MDQVKIISLMLLLIRVGYYTIAAYGLFLVVLWWKDTTHPIIFEDSSISKSQVQPGETVLVTQNLTKQRLCLGEVNRWMEGACGYKSFSENNAVLSVGPHRLLITVMIPSDAFSGPCRFMSRHQYICNPLDYLFNRKIYYSPPVNFEVVK